METLFENNEHCRICGFLRKAEIARIECERRAAFLVRQQTEPVDFNENLISIGNQVTFLTLYGYRTAIVTDVVKDTEKGFILHFEPMQIGPEGAFSATSRWCLNYNQQSCRKTN